MNHTPQLAINALQAFALCQCTRAIKSESEAQPRAALCSHCLSTFDAINPDEGQNEPSKGENRGSFCKSFAFGRFRVAYNR